MTLPSPKTRQTPALPNMSIPTTSFAVGAASLEAMEHQLQKSISELDMRPKNTVAETLKEGISLKIENEGGEMYISLLVFTSPNQSMTNVYPSSSFFRTRGTLIGGPHALGCSALNIELKNNDGNIYFEPVASSNPSSSWFTGVWVKLLTTAGTLYIYRNELRIIGRGMLAGANLAMDRWEQHRRQQDSDSKGKAADKRKEPGNDSKTSATQTEDHATNYSQPLPRTRLTPDWNIPPGYQIPQAGGDCAHQYQQSTHDISNPYCNYYNPNLWTYPTPGYQEPSCQSVRPTDSTFILRPGKQLAHNSMVQENHCKIGEDILGRDRAPSTPLDCAGKSVPLASSVDEYVITSDGSFTEQTDVPDSGSASVGLKHSYDSSGCEADVEVSEEEPMYCAGARVVGYQMGRAL